MKKSYIIFSLAILLFTSNSIAQNALNFDGNDDVVQTSFPGITGASDRTFEAWINVSTSAPASNLAITDFGINQAGARNTFLVDGNRGLRFVSGGTNANINSAVGVITPGQWTHVAFVLNNGTGFMYVNGVEVVTGNLSSVNTPTTGANLTIGERVSGGSIPFMGEIDEVRIWNIALDTLQIRANMNQTLCNYPTGLAAYFPLNEGVANGTNTSVTTTEDKISSSFATLSGFALTGTTSNWVPGAPVTGGNTFDTLTVTDCISYLSPSGKYNYTTSGTYSDTVPNSVGCDSILSINLTLVNNPTFANLTIDTCASYTVPSGKRTLTTSGSYLDTIPNAQGCDSIIAINLTVTIISKAVNTSGNNRLTASEAGGKYQWLNCNNGYTILQNDTNRFLDPPFSGSFAVQIIKNGCIDTTACVTVTGVGLHEDGFKSNFYISNNPTKNVFNLYNNNNITVATSLTSLNGKVMEVPQKSTASAIQFDLSELPTGVYILNIQDQEGSMAHFKIVKQ